MKAKFSGWYPKSAGEVSRLWDSATFAPDANVLLHCLRHAADVREEIFRLFDVLKAALWIPYQVGLEFHRNRLEVEFGAQDAYNALIRDQESVIEKARERLRQLRAHPTINVAREHAALDMFLNDFRARMEAARTLHPSLEIEDAVSRLTSLFDGRVGDKLKPDQIAALKKEGEDRYARKIPPGYMDAKKNAGDLDKFGDLIIWKEMIERAKATKRPLIFISDDAKEDWWWIHKGRKLGPRPELTEEFRAESGQSFHIYEFGQFLRFAADRFPEIQKNVERVEESLIADENARRRQSDAHESSIGGTRLRELEDERDELIGLLAGTPGISVSGASLDRSALRVRLGELNLEIERHLREPGKETNSASDSA